MGWWEIKSVENGQINFNKIYEDGIAHARFSEDDDNVMVNGDGPADTMGVAIDDIIKQYEKAWGRKPCVEEIQAVFNFVFNALPEIRKLKTAEEVGLEVSGGKKE